ncbi:MAG TPA: gamma-glutamyltransferase, partial [Verrucomicrobiae bacterium]|nr:gamma-glutamyltransferase [Verrucomicrobiae bacterium]
MGTKLWKQIIAGVAMFCLAFALGAAPTNETIFTHGVVASIDPIATDAGVNVLKSGGNAVDAAIVVGLTLGVVDTPDSGIGGGCFMLIHLADGRNIALDGRETAPAAATRDMFVRNGKGDTELSQTGPLASGVPGELAAFDFASRNYGKKSLRDLILPAAEIAEKGFTVKSSYARRLEAEAKGMAAFEASRVVFFKDGEPVKAGAILKQHDLAETYRQIGTHGADWFYRGPFAQAVEKWMKENDGLLTAADFANYHAQLRDPIESSYRGYRLVSFPPPSSGGVHVVEMLNILENFEMKKLDEVSRLHLIADAMKLAFADRAYWLG